VSNSSSSSISIVAVVVGSNGGVKDTDPTP